MAQVVHPVNGIITIYQTAFLASAPLSLVEVALVRRDGEPAENPAPAWLQYTTEQSVTPQGTHKLRVIYEIPRDLIGYGEYIVREVAAAPDGIATPHLMTLRVGDVVEVEGGALFGVLTGDGPPLPAVGEGATDQLYIDRLTSDYWRWGVPTAGQWNREGRLALGATTHVAAPYYKADGPKADLPAQAEDGSAIVEGTPGAYVVQPGDPQGRAGYRQGVRWDGAAWQDVGGPVSGGGSGGVLQWADPDGESIGAAVFLHTDTDNNPQNTNTGADSIVLGRDNNNAGAGSLVAGRKNDNSAGANFVTLLGNNADVIAGGDEARNAKSLAGKVAIHPGASNALALGSSVALRRPNEVVFAGGHNASLGDVQTSLHAFRAELNDAFLVRDSGDTFGDVRTEQVGFEIFDEQTAFGVGQVTGIHRDDGRAYHSEVRFGVRRGQGVETLTLLYLRETVEYSDLADAQLQITVVNDPAAPHPGQLRFNMVGSDMVLLGRMKWHLFVRLGEAFM